MNSRTSNCRRCLNEVANRYDVCLAWVPGHRDIPGNCRADELARRGAITDLSVEFSILHIPLGTCKLIIDNTIVDLVYNRWLASNTGRTVQKIFPRSEKRRSTALLNLQRSKFNTVYQDYYGAVYYRNASGAYWFWTLFCRSCRDVEEEDETVLHLLRSTWVSSIWRIWMNCHACILAV